MALKRLFRSGGGRRARGISVDPNEVTHAFDYFVWSALDDRTFQPEKPRPFGDDERYYNAVLNAYLFPDEVREGELTSSETKTLPRLPSFTQYAPHYFPDGATALVIVKNWHLWQHIGYRVERLRQAAKMAEPFAPGMECPDDFFVLRDEAYVGYYKSLQAAGRRFSEASREEREAACVLSMKAALNHNDEVGDEPHDELAYLVSRNVTRSLLPDFEEPEALLPSPDAPGSTA